MLFAALAGCAGPPLAVVDRWTVQAGDAPPAMVTVPVRLDRTLVPTAVARFSLSARVELPAAVRGSALELVIPDLADVPLLSVDGGGPTLPNGATSTGYRVRGPHIWPIPAVATADGVVELRLEVENRWTQSSWLTAAPRLVPLGNDPRAAVARRCRR